MDGMDGLKATDAETMRDDIIFRSCMVQSEHHGCVFTLKHDESERYTGSNPQPATAALPYSAWWCEEARDPSKPALQPGAGTYTSPLTVHVAESAGLQDVIGVIKELLRVLRMPNEYDADKFKFYVAAYFTSGFARFTVRIWRRAASCREVTDTAGGVSAVAETYAVEVMRERGDRIFATRSFEFLSSALQHCSDEAARATVLSKYETGFTPDMFDWSSPPLPPDVLQSLPEPSAEAKAAGIASMVSMVGSTYDDVAVNGCASVAKLAAASTRTRESMAGSPELVQTLLQVVSGVRVRAGATDDEETLCMRLSVDTRSNAALALAELALDPSGHGVNNVMAAFTVSPACLQAIASICTKGVDGTPGYAVLCLRTDCVRILSAVALAGGFPAVLQHLTRMLLAGTDTATKAYAPFTSAVRVLETTL